jgi:flagellar motility protein MotE (MotC chaperone)
MAELRKQKETIALKEKELTDLAARLQAERAELSQMTQAVQRVQSEFDRNVARIQEQETTNLKRLAKLYSTMTPEGAAAVFKALDDSTLVKVLAHMKDADMAPVLEILARQGEADAKRVAAISEQLRMLLPATTTKTP